ncbi:hypothetical protein EZV62_021081 [Acer yangbiense]|uniref:Pentacotripeptide-repeat region of PRORP domain-containing protein n=1 Tax=Acer yangbiense TaxID=1000413 RepID=A0A5C7H673_9ROSI|nr:hypothetical protein EZV62_021081 [Acer yangbiense]
MRIAKPEVWKALVKNPEAFEKKLKSIKEAIKDVAAELLNLGVDPCMQQKGEGILWKVPKNLRSPRRTKLPPDFGVNLFLKKPRTDTTDPSHTGIDDDDFTEEEESGDKELDGSDVVWEEDEIEAISSLFQGRIPQKPGFLYRERPLPLPLPHKLRPLGLPTPKEHVKLLSRESMCKKVYKNPSFLINLAREIKGLSSNEDVCVVLDKCARFLRKGSLSLTIRELGHMALPERALQTFCWTQKQPHLFPDDRILASTVEVLARHHELKMPFNLEKFSSLASRSVIEAMVRGFIKGGSLKLALKLLWVAKNNNRMLDPSIYAKLILELIKNPDRHVLVDSLLDELAQREDLNLNQQDCTAIMKVGIRLRKFEIVESLFHWFTHSGHDPSVVMYTTLIHSRCSEKKYREALAVVWEMEASECLFDLPAYRVVIKLFVSLNDLSRAVRYFSKLKEAGFSPTYDIYRDLIKVYMVSGRLAKCKMVCREAEMAGFKLDKQTRLELLHIER